MRRGRASVHGGGDQLPLRGVASWPYFVVAAASCCQLPRIGDGYMGFDVG